MTFSTVSYFSLAPCARLELPAFC